MFDLLETRQAMAAWVADLEPGVYSGEHALSVLDLLSDMKRLAAAAETL